MAYFTYNITFNKQSLAPNLSNLVKSEIEKKAFKNLKLSNYDNNQFVISYRTDFTGERVYLGIEKWRGKLFGTEEAKMQFAGSEDHILELKSKLLELVDGLQLS